MDLSHMGVSSSAFATVEARLAEAFRKLDHVSKESQDVQTRVEAQEERLRSLRTIVDAKEENYRVSKFDRQDWESKAKELQSVAAELERHRVDHGERLDVYQRKLENYEQAHVEVSELMHKIQERGILEGAVVLEGAASARDPDDSVTESAALATIMDRNLECINNIAVMDERLHAMSAQMDALRGDAELAPRVGNLVEALQQVAPKVMDQEVCLQELHQKVGHLDAKIIMLCDQNKNQVNEPLNLRLGVLESEIKRLCAEIDGTEQPDNAG